MARPGLDLWTQLVALHCSRLAAPSLSVLEFEGQFQQEVWPHCGWKEPTGQGRQVLLGQEKKLPASHGSEIRRKLVDL